MPGSRGDPKPGRGGGGGGGGAPQHGARFTEACARAATCVVLASCVDQGQTRGRSIASRDPLALSLSLVYSMAKVFCWVPAARQRTSAQGQRRSRWLRRRRRVTSPRAVCVRAVCARVCAWPVATVLATLWVFGSVFDVCSGSCCVLHDATRTRTCDTVMSVYVYVVYSVSYAHWPHAALGLGSASLVC